MQLLVRGGDQASVIGFGHRAALALAPAVDTDPVEQVTPAAGLRHTSPATDTPEPLPQTVTTGVWPRRAQVRAFGGRRFCPASSSKTIHAPAAAASLEPSPTSRPATRRSSPHHAPQPGAPGPAGCTRSGAAGTRCPAACSGHGTAPDQRRDPGQRPPLVLTPPQAAGPRPARPAAGPAAPRPAATAPPGPMDAKAASPPARQRRRHAYAEFDETRSRRATSGGVTPSANHSAACNRTSSRLARPAADKPPPSGYLITPQ